MAYNTEHRCLQNPFEIDARFNARHRLKWTEEKKGTHIHLYTHTNTHTNQTKNDTSAYSSMNFH